MSNQSQPGDLPKRPVQHERRDQAVNALNVALPPGWQLQKRDGDSDYGLDGDIEVFEQGSATGIRFPVQVKGTARVEGQPSTRIRWSTWNYWRAQEGPVLVALWDEETGQIYWNWAHRFDPWRLDRSIPQFTFTFPRRQVWGDPTAEELLTEVRAWRAWTNPYIHFPIQVAIRGTGRIAGLEVGRVVGHLRERAASFTGLFTASRSANDLLKISIDVTESETILWISGGPSNTIHHDQFPAVLESPEAEVSFVDQFTSDVLACVARHLMRLNLVSDAGRVLSEVVESANLPLHPDHVVPILQILLDSQRTEEATKLIERVLVEGPPETLSTLHLHLQSHPYDEITGQRIVDSVVRVVRWRQEFEPDAAEVARSAYNAAQVARRFAPSVAVSMLNEAKALDLGYAERAYWWRDRGGCRFLSGDIAGAVEDYRWAWDLGDEKSGPLLADALIYSGEYQQALDLLRRLYDQGNLDESEWRLKGHAIDFLIGAYGIERQTRDHDEAHRRLPESLNEGALVESLEADLLCASALGGLAELCKTRNDRSVDLYVAAAVFDPENPAGWMNALAAAISEDPDLTFDIGMCARRVCGDRIMSWLETTGVHEELVEALELFFRDLPPEPPPPLEIRLTTSGTGQFNVLEFDEQQAG